ncbi:MAG TPA: hypothetical protein VK279_03855 [Solirubrobacteraceae bacterium]|nr:hypothetical protein [Solirubrobacteraceae bacterium]
MTPIAPVTVRSAYPDDRAAIARLATLDSRPPPEGEVLVADVEGELWAALSVDSGERAADPFRPTGEVVRLLDLRARQLGRGYGVQRSPAGVRTSSWLMPRGLWAAR